MARLQSGAAIAVRLGIVRTRGERAVVARHRLVEPVQAAQRVAAIGERLGIIRPHRQSAVVTRQRFLKSLQLVQRDAAIAQDFRMVAAKI